MKLHIKHNEVSIGRVISARRRCGLGSKIVKAGFKQNGNEFLEDGIPHIPMILTFER